MMHPITAMQLAQARNEELLKEAAQRRRLAQARTRQQRRRAPVADAQQVRSRCADCEESVCVCRAGPPAAVTDRHPELATSAAK